MTGGRWAFGLFAAACKVEILKPSPGRDVSLDWPGAYRYFAAEMNCPKVSHQTTAVV
jgi:hypothetical protein